MRIIFSILTLFLFSGAARAQDPTVKWTFSSKKIGDKTYEVHLTAKIESPWHIYSQTTPAGGPIPTTIQFAKNPLVTLSGSAKEVGKMVKKHEEVFDVDVKYFDTKVDFVQVVKLKAAAKTTLTGTIEYMVCTNEECLPPQEVSFSVKLE